METQTENIPSRIEQPYLAWLGNHSEIHKQIRNALYEQISEFKNNSLGQDSKNLIDKLYVGFNEGYELSCALPDNPLPLGWFLDSLTGEISKEIYSKGFKLCEQKFKRFDPRKTKLTPEILEEIWFDVSSSFREIIYRNYDNCVFNDPIYRDYSKIPGLQLAIDGPIVKQEDSTETEESIALRGILKNNLNRTDDIIDFYLRARNNLFNHWQNQYGLFNGGKKINPNQ